MLASTTLTSVCRFNGHYDDDDDDGGVGNGMGYVGGDGLEIMPLILLLLPEMFYNHMTLASL